ncbi:MAG TPA: hypothetical protein VGC20_10370 [bacterium]
MKTTRWTVLAAVLALAVALLWVPTLATAGMEPLSSGVSQEDRAPRPDYPLKFVFAMASGAYLADIAVTIKDLDGKEVLRTQSSGPWLYLDLPAGQYVVVAKRMTGEKVSALFTVGGEGQRVVRLTWSEKR